MGSPRGERIILHHADTRPEASPGASTDLEHPSSSPGALRAWLAAVGCFVVTFLIRFLAVSFENDDFMPISKSRQMLHGELPFRDFYDAGYYIQVFGTALLQQLFGHQLLSEALLIVFTIAASVAGVCALTTMTTRSVGIAIAVAALFMISFPKFNSYPKVYPFVVAMWLFLRYARKPSMANGILVGAALLLAFYSRHDIGVYVGIGAGILLLACHARDRRLPRPVIAAGLTVLLGAAPLLAFLQFNGGVPEYFRQAGSFIQGTRTYESQFARPALQFDLSQPLITERPIGENPERASVRIQQAVPLLRWSILPGFITQENVLAFSYWLFVSVPLVTLAVLGVRRWRGQRTPDGAWLLAIAVMCAAAQQGLLRSPLADRLADVAATTALLAGWLLAYWLSLGPWAVAETSARSTRPLWRTVTAGAVLAVAGLSLISSTAFGRLASPDGLAGLVQRGPLGVVRQVQETAGYLATSPPIDAWDVPANPGLPALARWINECTHPGDRILATWWAAELYFYANRPFGAGHVFFLPGFWLDERDQEILERRLHAQDIPIVVSEMTHYDNIAPGLYRLRRFLVENYRVVKEDGFGSAQHRYRIWVPNNAIPERTYERLGLPCFR